VVQQGKTAKNSPDISDGVSDIPGEMFNKLKKLKKFNRSAANHKKYESTKLAVEDLMSVLAEIGKDRKNGV
jgi:hypothetical protein